MIKGLRRNFILISMCSIFIVLVTIIGISDIVNYKNIIERADNITEVLAENGGTFTEPEKPKEDSERPTLGENEKAPEPKDEMMDKNGLSPETQFSSRFFTVTYNEKNEIQSVNLDKIVAVSAKEAKEYANKIIDGNSKLGFEDIYRYRKVQTDDGYMVIFLDCRQELESFRSTTISMIGVSTAGLVAVFVLVLIFSKIVFRPVEESYRKQKRFITDASHELKTPLTIIDANTEVIEMEYGENQWTKSTKNQVDRLTALTGQMVTLSRLDEETNFEDMEEFSISDVLADSVESYEAITRTKEKQLHLDLDENLSIYGSEKSIRQLMGLLLDNAVKYSSEKGNIYVKLKSVGKKILIEVENDVDDIAKGNLNVLFERFYRLDASRNSETGGSGIGLSVARAIVESHKGKISAYSEDGKHLNITIEFRKAK